jgi:hypothetical protein
LGLAKLELLPATRPLTLLLATGISSARTDATCSFVAVNAAGNAVGVMTKEQVASVLAGLIGINNTWFRDGGIVINPDNCLNNRVYMINISLGTINFDLFTYGNLLYFSQGEYHTQIAMSIYDNKRFTRMSSNGGNAWGEWREF